MNAAVSIIIPTTCVTARRDMLWRAIRSILDQDWEWIEVIVVVNGSQFDQAVFDELGANSKLRIIHQAQPNVALAQRRGRLEISSPFFGFLDDDDEYLPGAIRSRLEPMLADQSIDAVVTNGVRRTGSQERLNFVEFDSAKEDPLYALVSCNWLASCGGLFRTASIDEKYFDGQTKYNEWTLLAIRMASDRKNILFLDQPTYRIHVTPGSVSASNEYQMDTASFLEAVLRRPLPSKVRRGIRRKLSATYHDLAEFNRATGRIREARRYHLRSLVLPGGLRYLAYSRKLVFPSPSSNIDT